MSKGNLMKKVSLLVSMLVLLVSATVSAQIKAEDINMGGLNLNSTYEQVIACYGKPDVVRQVELQLVDTEILYGDSVAITFSNGVVRKIVVSANNGWRTSDGVHVGMSLNEAMKIYGVNYEEIPDLPGLGYQYVCVPESFVYEPGDTKWIIRLVDPDTCGKIHSITIFKATPEY